MFPLRIKDQFLVVSYFSQFIIFQEFGQGRWIVQTSGPYHPHHPSQCDGKLMQKTCCKHVFLGVAPRSCKQEGCFLFLHSYSQLPTNDKKHSLEVYTCIYIYICIHKSHLVKALHLVINIKNIKKNSSGQTNFSHDSPTNGETSSVRDLFCKTKLSEIGCIGPFGVLILPG